MKLKAEPPFVLPLEKKQMGGYRNGVTHWKELVLPISAPAKHQQRKWFDDDDLSTCGCFVGGGVDAEWRRVAAMAAVSESSAKKPQPYDDCSIVLLPLFDTCDTPYVVYRQPEIRSACRRLAESGSSRMPSETGQNSAPQKHSGLGQKYEF
jgi:hypothetical protein